jgi:hypothetical protein
MRNIGIGIAISIAVVICHNVEVIGASLAFDSAGDAAYDTGWLNNNGGFGWGGDWQYGTSYGGTFAWNVASATLNGNNGDINAPTGPNGRAWALTTGVRPGVVDLSSATRPLDGTLSVGQVIECDYDNAVPIGDNGFTDSGFGAQIVELQSAAPLNISVPFEFGASDNSPDYEIWVEQSNGILSPSDTGIPISTDGYHLAFTLTSLSTYSFAVTPLISGGMTSTFTGSIDPDFPINQINFTDSGSGTDLSTAMYFNNIAVVPEPKMMPVLLTPALIMFRPRPRGGKVGL